MNEGGSMDGTVMRMGLVGERSDPALKGWIWLAIGDCAALFVALRRDQFE